MTALQQEFWGSIDESGKSDGIEMRETPWGFTFAEDSGRLGIDALAEGSLKVFALTIMMASSFLWILPLSEFSLGMTGRSAITAISMLVGYALFRYANRGFALEYQVDTIKREVRVATRNTNHMSTLRQTISMRDIKSSFIRRPAKSTAKSTLNFRLQGRVDPMPLISARESVLVPVLERLMQCARRRSPERRHEEV